MRISKSVASVFASAFALIQLTGSMLPVLPVQAKAPVSPGRAKAPIWSNNIKVPYRSWLPRTRPKEILLCVHGLGFSSLSYTEFGHVMASRGYGVYALDVRGFGEWMNSRENRVDFEGCLNDIQAALKTLRKLYPGCKIDLVGESMGGAIVLAAASRYPDLVDGIVSSVPSSDRYAKMSSTIVVGAKYLTNKDKPMNIAPEVVERATENKALQKHMEATPTNRMKLTPKELKQFNDFMKGNYDAAALIEKTPILLMAGFKDQLVKPEGTVELFNSIGTDDKLLMVVGDGEHLLLEENQLTEQLTDLLITWLQHRR
ncbi:MAG: alpha/beta fold hydrolase [Candidatus Obscuribacterales bacterium]